MSEIRKHINLKITLFLGEKGLNLFSNSIGKTSQNEIESKFSFQEVVDIQKKVLTNDYSEFIDFCNENQMTNVVEFLISVKEIMIHLYEVYSDIAMLESAGEIKFTEFKVQAHKLYDENQTLFKQEFGKLILNNKSIQESFQNIILKGEPMSSISNDQLREGVKKLSVVSIAMVLDKKYKELKQKPMTHFKSFFNEDHGNQAMSVVKEIQDHGI